MTLRVAHFIPLVRFVNPPVRRRQSPSVVSVISCSTALLRLSGLIVLLLLLSGSTRAQGDAMLQLFNLSWNEIADKIPEIAEAGYSSLWLPPPAKGGSGFSVGDDLFDPFDLGD